MADQASATIRLIATIPRIIPTIEEMPILPVAFRNQTRDMIPSRIAVMAKMPVRMTHERMPKIRLKKPSQFLLRFGAAFGTAAGAGTAAGDDCITGTTGAGAGAAAGEDTGAGCARDAACLFPRGFPQLLQNWLVSGFRVPHSPQNIFTLRRYAAGPPQPNGQYRCTACPPLPTAMLYGMAVHIVLTPTPWPLASRARQVCWLISPTNIRLSLSVPIAMHASLLLFFMATSHRQSTFR